MSYFVNLTKANADNARLSAELTALVGERDKLTLAITERDAAAQSVAAQFEASLADLNEKLSASNAEVARLKAEATTAGEQAAAAVASQGLPPEKLPNPAAGPASAPAMKRAEFNALSPFDRMTFAKSGGRLVE